MTAPTETRTVPVPLDLLENLVGWVRILAAMEPGTRLELGPGTRDRLAEHLERAEEMLEEVRRVLLGPGCDYCSARPGGEHAVDCPEKTIERGG